MHGTAPLLSALRDRFSEGAAPVVVFNKSHSGSRLLAELLEAGGIFMGAHRNESHDSLDLLGLVEYLVEKYYPDYSALWSGEGSPDTELIGLIEETFAAHRVGSPPEAPWGWKLCETTYILPVIDFLFPRALYLHLLRDGRDVAFCDHTPPDTPFWKKIYYNTDRIATARALRLNRQDYRRRSHLHNAQHWVNSVTIGRAHGAMLRERYREVRYEDLCRNFNAAARGVLDFVRAPHVEEALEKIGPRAHGRSIGKYQTKPRRQQREVVALEKPLLLSLGYLESDPFPIPSRSWRRRLRALFRRNI